MQSPPFANKPVYLHPSAIVSHRATLGAGVEVGPYAVIEHGVTIGDRTRVMAHSYIASGTEIGPDCEIHMGAVLGNSAQIRDLAERGGGLTIGARTIIREHVTIHRSSRPDGWTVVGEENLLLAACHVAHDCRIGHRTTIANGALLAGWVTLGDGAFVSGNVVIHQYVAIGTLSMIGGNSRMAKDLPPFMLAVGDTQVRGTNVVGMRRAGLSPEQRQNVKRAYHVLYRSGLSVSHALARLRQLEPSTERDLIVTFVEQSRRGICAGGPRWQRQSLPPSEEDSQVR